MNHSPQQSMRLLRCPFCGSQPEVLLLKKGEDMTQDMTVVQCTHVECAAGPVVSGVSAEEAAQRWNRRHQQPIRTTPAMLGHRGQATKRRRIADLGTGA